jgi:hypothetical protein
VGDGRPDRAGVRPPVAAQAAQAGGGAGQWRINRLVGYLIQSYGGRLVSFDHEASYAALTAETIRRHGLADIVEVRHAPLQAAEIGDRGYLWYEASAFDDLEGIDLLVVDGPPDSSGLLQARMPAFWMLRERLADRALVMLDDTGRAGEQAIVAAWTGEQEVSVLRDLNGRAMLLEYRAPVRAVGILR